MTGYCLAQLNIAKIKFAIDAPETDDFVARLEDVNALADAAAGFVWRLQTDAGDATGIDFLGPDYLVNMSVWENIDSLRDYVFRSAHREVLARRKRWFARMDAAWAVLWWIETGRTPALHEAGERLDYLRLRGPTPRAFTLARPFGASEIE